MQGRVALVTGAAQGIGAVIAEALTKAGATVVVADMQVEKGQARVAELQALGGAAHFVPVDLTQPEEIKALVERTVETCGGLDALINNAAPFRGERKSFPENLTTWPAELDVLLRAPGLLVGEALPHLERSTAGAVVNVVSMLGFRVSNESSAYHSAKAALSHLTRYLAWHLGPKGVRVNAVSPGLVDREQSPRLSDDPLHRSVIETAVPLRRAGRARETAEAVLFLCSERASYITGQVLEVDGGLGVGEQFEVGRQVLRRAAQD